MLELVNLVKKYGTVTALDGVNLNIAEGSIFGFVGPNGAGKTTAFKIITGLLAATSGEVRIHGDGISASRPKLAERIGYMPDFFGVYDNLKVSEYMDFYAGTYYIPYRQRKATIDHLLDVVNLTGKQDEYVDSLSRGMKQRLCLARSLIHNPEILILDEPASGLDPRSRVEMKMVLKQLREFGKTIIISSHILPELAEMCTDIGIISNGKMVAVGSVEDILNNLQSARIIQMKPLGGVLKLADILRGEPEIGDITQVAGSVEFAFSGDDAALAALVKHVVQHDIGIVAVAEKQGSLEDVYLQLTQETGEQQPMQESEEVISNA